MLHLWQSLSIADCHCQAHTGESVYGSLWKLLVRYCKHNMSVLPVFCIILLPLGVWCKIKRKVCTISNVVMLCLYRLWSVQWHMAHFSVLSTWAVLLNFLSMGVTHQSPHWESAGAPWEVQMLLLRQSSQQTAYPERVHTKHRRTHALCSPRMSTEANRKEEVKGWEGFHCCLITPTLFKACHFLHTRFSMKINDIHFTCEWSWCFGSSVYV